MFTVICDKTGIQFEAESKRQKNHPAISALLAKSTKYGNYGAALTAMAEVKAAGNMTITEAIAFVNQRMDETDAERQKRRIAEEREEKARTEARLERKALNDNLYRHGYTWHKEDEESMDAFGATAFSDLYGNHVSEVWILTNPEGHEVTVAQALASINQR